MIRVKTVFGIALLAIFFSGLKEVSGQEAPGSLIPEFDSVLIPEFDSALIPEVGGNLMIPEVGGNLLPELESSLIPMVHIDDPSTPHQSVAAVSDTNSEATGSGDTGVHILTSDLPTPVTVPDPLSVHYSEVAPAEEQVVTEVVMTERADCECQRSMCHCGRVRYDLLHPPKTMMPPLLSMDVTSTYYYFRPYNWRQILENQADAARWGASPGNPYSNQVFEAIYESIDFDEL